MKKETEPTPAEIIAIELKKISASMKALADGGLKREAIVVLVAHKTKVSMSDIRAVMDSLRDLAIDWTL